MTVATAAICHCYINRDFQLYKKNLEITTHHHNPSGAVQINRKMFKATGLRLCYALHLLKEKAFECACVFTIRYCYWLQRVSEWPKAGKKPVPLLLLQSYEPL